MSASKINKRLSAIRLAVADSNITAFKKNKPKQPNHGLQDFFKRFRDILDMLLSNLAHNTDQLLFREFGGIKYKEHTEVLFNIVFGLSPLISNVIRLFSSIDPVNLSRDSERIVDSICHISVLFREYNNEHRHTYNLIVENLVSHYNANENPEYDRITKLHKALIRLYEGTFMAILVSHYFVMKFKDALDISDSDELIDNLCSAAPFIYEGNASQRKNISTILELEDIIETSDVVGLCKDAETPYNLMLVNPEYNLFNIDGGEIPIEFIRNLCFYTRDDDLMAANLNTMKNESRFFGKNNQKDKGVLGDGNKFMHKWDLPMYDAANSSYKAYSMEYLKQLGELVADNDFVYYFKRGSYFPCVVCIVGSVLLLLRKGTFEKISRDTQKGPTTVPFSLIVKEIKISELDIVVLKGLSESLFNFEGNVLQVNTGNKVFFLGGDHTSLKRLSKIVNAQKNNIISSVSDYINQNFKDTLSISQDMSKLSIDTSRMADKWTLSNKKTYSCEVVYMTTKDDLNSKSNDTIISFYTNMLSNWTTLQSTKSLRVIQRCSIGCLCLMIESSSIQNTVKLISPLDTSPHLRLLKFAKREQMRTTLVIFNYIRTRSIKEFITTNTYFFKLLEDSKNIILGEMQAYAGSFNCIYSQLHKVVHMTIEEESRTDCIKIMALDNVVISLILLKSQINGKHLYVIDLRSDVFGILAANDPSTFPILKGGSLSLLLVKNKYTYRFVEGKKLEIKIENFSSPTTPPVNELSHMIAKISVLSDKRSVLDNLHNTLNTIEMTELSILLDNPITADCY